MVNLINEFSRNSKKSIEFIEAIKENEDDPITYILLNILHWTFWDQINGLEVIKNCTRDTLLKQKQPKVGEVLVNLLGSMNDLIRSETSIILGKIGHKRAIPILQQAIERAKSNKVPLDSFELQSYFEALTMLGARDPIIPKPARELMIFHPLLLECWEFKDYKKIVEIFTNHSQIPLSFQFWSIAKIQSSEFGPISVGETDYKLDFTKEWSEVVQDSKQAAFDFIKQFSTIELIYKNHIYKIINYLQESTKCYALQLTEKLKFGNEAWFKVKWINEEDR